MSATSVDAAHDAIAALIVQAAQQRESAKNQMLSARNRLAAITTTYATEIAEVNAYTPTGALETLAKDRQAKYATEFTALKNTLETELTALGVSYS